MLREKIKINDSIQNIILEGYKRGLEIFLLNLKEDVQEQEKNKNQIKKFDLLEKIFEDLNDEEGNNV